MRKKGETKEHFEASRPMRRKRRLQDTDDIERAVRLHDRSVSYRGQGEYEKAESLGRQALKFLEKAVGQNHPDVANVLNNLAGIHADRGEYAEAERLYQRSVDVMEGIDEGDADVERIRTQSLYNLAGIYRVQGRYDEAEPILQRALAIAEKALGPNDLEVASVLNNLGVLYKYQGRFDEGERIYRRALDITEKALGSEHPDVATIYHNLGGLEHSRGQYARGEPFARKAVEIRKKALGPDHPDVAGDMAALAAILDSQEKYDEAEELYRKALEIFERVFGPEHYELAVNFNNLAAIAYEKGDETKAERLYKRALAIKGKVLGPDHPDVAMSLNNLAVLYKSQKRYSEAESLYHRALSILETLGPEHPNYVTCLENLAQLTRELKALKERRFECQNCGICCSHKGLIQPSEANIRELAKFLHVSEWPFAIRYLQEVYDPDLDAYIMAFKTNNPQDPKNGCIFHFGSFCAIYNSCRTDLCKVFPWCHFDIKKEEWNLDFVNNDGTFWCRGIGKGREWTIEEISEIKANYTNLGVGFRRHLNQDKNGSSILSVETSQSRIHS